MYGLMLGGIEGGLMNFSLVTTVNAYGITVDPDVLYRSRMLHPYGGD